MRIRKDIIEIRAALAVVRESEALRFHLMVSINSSSSIYELIDSGLESYLRATKTALKIQLVVSYVMIVCGSLSKTTLTVLRTRWSRVTERVKSICMMN